MKYFFSLIGFYLISINCQSQEAVIKQTLIESAINMGLQPSDFEHIEVTNQASSLNPDVKHYYVSQELNGIKLINGNGVLTFKNNKLIHISNRFVSTSAIKKPNAFLNEVTTLKLLFASDSSILISENNLTKLDNNHSIYNDSLFFKRPVKIEFNYYFSAEQALELVWNISYEKMNSTDWMNEFISVETGSILYSTNWTTHCHFQSENKKAFPVQSKAPCPPPNNNNYSVYELPVYSPQVGIRSDFTNPMDVNYSPFGWHDTNGVIGEEFTITQGNNVHSFADHLGNNQPYLETDGGPALDFTFPLDFNSDYSANMNAAVTNLFYVVNYMHDLSAYYGFTEENGNFQQTNYSHLGLENDFVSAQAQDLSWVNNADFSTPPDGGNPTMQMYLWNNDPVLEDSITVSSLSQTMVFQTKQASFGVPIPISSIIAPIELVVDDGVNPNDGCGTISSSLSGKIALVKKGNCSYLQKVQNCQDLGALAVVVINSLDTVANMTGTTTTISIPSMMIGSGDGDSLINQLTLEQCTGEIQRPLNTTSKDGSFENTVIIHEYTHGISTRLTGGAANSNCLSNAEQMGEGWSDWMGLMPTIQNADNGEMPRSIATYLIGEPIDGIGIRPAPYSTDFAVNNYTYGNTNDPNIAQPHGIGFIWATMLWDLTWAFIDQYGFDQNLKTGNGGNNKVMKIVYEAMKIQPCGPGFVDARDAILLSDTLLNNAENSCLIWKVFASRGLGYSANQGYSFSRFDQTEAFDLPADCSLQTENLEKNFNSLKLSPNPSSDMIQLSGTKNASKLIILSVLGEKLFETTLGGDNEIRIPISGLTNGTYFINISNDHSDYTLPFVKN